MKTLKQIGGWLVAAVTSLGLVLMIVRWWAERKRRTQLGGTAVDLAEENAARARDQATAELDAAIARGEAHVAAEDAAADERIDNDKRSLADLLHDADPGPRRRKDD